MKDFEYAITGKDSFQGTKEAMIKNYSVFRNLQDLLKLIESLNVRELDVLGDSLAVLMERQKKSMQKKFGMRAQRNWPFKIEGKFLESGIGYPLIDHQWMLRIKGKRTYYISESYDIFMDDLESLIKFCKENEMEFKIDAHKSTYYPGYTTGIFIYKKKDF